MRYLAQPLNLFHTAIGEQLGASDKAAVIQNASC